MRRYATRYLFRSEACRLVLTSNSLHQQQQVGQKRWVLFPPDTPKEVVKSKSLYLKDEDDEAVNYFVDLIPRMKDKHKNLTIYEFTQNPGVRSERAVLKKRRAKRQVLMPRRFAPRGLLSDEYIVANELRSSRDTQRRSARCY